MKVYLRLDPLLDERKVHYTAAQLGAFIKVLLLLGRGTHAGRFRGSVDDLKRCLTATFSRHVGFLVEQGDLVCRDGFLYVDGWDEWQEGDLTVKDRVAKLRARKKRGDVTPDVTPQAVTPDDDQSVGCNALTSTPTPTPTHRSSLREEAPVGADRSLDEKTPDGDPLVALLSTKSRAFTLAPWEKAAQVRVWGLGFEDVGRLWDHAQAVSEVPVRMFRWMLKDPGKAKVALSKLPQVARRPVLAEALSEIGAVFSIRRATRPETLWERQGGGGFAS